MFPLPGSSMVTTSPTGSYPMGALPVVMGSELASVSTSAQDHHDELCHRVHQTYFHRTETDDQGVPPCSATYFVQPYWRRSGPWDPRFPERQARSIAIMLFGHYGRATRLQEENLYRDVFAPQAFGSSRMGSCSLRLCACTHTLRLSMLSTQAGGARGQIQSLKNTIMPSSSKTVVRRGCACIGLP